MDIFSGLLNKIVWECCLWTHSCLSLKLGPLSFRLIPWVYSNSGRVVYSVEWLHGSKFKKKTPHHMDMQYTCLHSQGQGDVKMAEGEILTPTLWRILDKRRLS